MAHYLRVKITLGARPAAMMTSIPARRAIRRLQLGGHAARTECSATATSNFAQCVINGGHFFDQLGIGIFTRVGGEQSLLIGQ